MYRTEALENRSTPQTGDVFAARLPDYRWLLAGACLAAILVLCFGLWGQVTRKEHVQGYLAPRGGLIKLTSPLPATVVDAPIPEGRHVKKGEVLVTLTTERSATNMHGADRSQQREVRLRRESLVDELSRQALLDSLAQVDLVNTVTFLQAQLARATNQVELQRLRVESAEQALRRDESLVAENFLSRAALQQKQDASMEHRARLEDAMQAVDTQARQLIAARNEAAAAEPRASSRLAALRRQISELDQQLAEADARATIVLVAPTPGVVVSLAVQKGQQVSADTTVIRILPDDSELAAQLLVPTRAIGFVQVGQAVALRYQAFPYERFGHVVGRVSQVGHTTIPAGEVDVLPKSQEPVFRVTVTLPTQTVLAQGKEHALRAGMTLDAEVWLERRSILQWMLDPLSKLVERN